MQRTRDRGRTRRETIPITVWCLPEERQLLESYAHQTGLSLSSFLRRAALGCEIKSNVDYRAVHDLLRIHADMNRLGNLLKMWLADRSRVSPNEVRDLPRQIGECCRQLVAAADKVLEA